MSLKVTVWLVESGCGNLDFLTSWSSNLTAKTPTVSRVLRVGGAAGLGVGETRNLGPPVSYVIFVSDSGVVNDL